LYYFAHLNQTFKAMRELRLLMERDFHNLKENEIFFIS